MIHACKLGSIEDYEGDGTVDFNDSSVCFANVGGCQNGDRPRQS